MVIEHEKDRDEVPDHWQCHTRDQINKMKVWRNDPVVRSASYVTYYEDNENYGDSFHTLTQVLASLPNFSEWIEKRYNCYY